MHKLKSYYKNPYVFMALNSIVVLFMIETLSRLSFSSSVFWMGSFPLEAMCNFILIYLIYVTACVAFSNKSGVYFILDFLFYTLSLISGIKLKIMGVPLLPNDLFLIKEASDVSQHIQQIFQPQVILVASVCLILIIVKVFLYPKSSKLNVKVKAITLTTSIIMLVVFYTAPSSVLSALGVTDLRWDQNANYLDNGFAVAASSSIKTNKMKKLSDYSHDSIDKLISGFSEKAEKSKEVTLNNNTKPTNIIILLSESLWDPKNAGKLQLSKDPLSYYHHLSEKYPSGSMMTSQFGGGTANVEFEVLTGYSVPFLAPGTNPFLQLLDKEVESIASILNEQGYYSTVFNSYLNWFYNSRTAYKNLGFNQFISNEFLRPIKKGPYLSDEILVDSIIEQTERTKGNDFIFASTMGNHFPYNEDKFEETEIKVLNKDITAETKTTLESYAQGVYYFDKALEKLVKHYSDSKEPTVVLVFGDHLPILGNDYSVFKELNYFRESNDKETMYRTPLLVWDNYKKHTQKEELELNATFITPYLLDYTELDGNYFTKYLWSLYNTKSIPPINSMKDISYYEDELHDYMMLQYDTLYGERFAYDITNKKQKIRDINYVLGWGNVGIKDVEIFYAQEGGSTISIKGENFAWNHRVFFNGEELVSSYGGKEWLTAEVPNELVKIGEPNSIQVLLKDSKNTVISESNVFTISMEKEKKEV